jgi:hypothetical protein
MNSLTPEDLSSKDQKILDIILYSQQGEMNLNYMLIQQRKAGIWTHKPNKNSP